MRQEGADRRSRGVEFSRERHRARGVEQDGERHRRVLGLLEHIARYALAVHEEAHLATAEIGDWSALITQNGERDHDVADGDSLLDARSFLREGEGGDEYRGSREESSQH